MNARSVRVVKLKRRQRQGPRREVFPPSTQPRKLSTDGTYAAGSSESRSARSVFTQRVATLSVEVQTTGSVTFEASRDRDPRISPSPVPCRGVGEAPQLCALLGDAHPNFITETGGAQRTQSQLLRALQTLQPRAFISPSDNFKDRDLNVKYPSLINPEELGFKSLKLFRMSSN